MTVRARDPGENPFEAIEAEVHDYRVVLWRPQKPFAEHGTHVDASWSAEIHDVTAEDVHEVIDWANDKAGRDAIYTLYVLHDHAEVGNGKTLLQIAGADPTVSSDPPPPYGFRRTQPLRD
jgi:hypothetical protein